MPEQLQELLNLETAAYRGNVSRITTGRRFPCGKS